MRWLVPTVAAVAISAAALSISSPALACLPELSPDPLETKVANADVIFVGAITDDFTVPPLDPDVQDAEMHGLWITIGVTDYLKGTGSTSFTFGTHVSYYWMDGELQTAALDCSTFGQLAVGTPYVVLGRYGTDSLTVIQAASTDTPYGQEILQKVLDILNATPTPSPTPSPLPTPSVTPTSLPRSGDGIEDTSNGFAGYAFAAAAVGGFVAFAYILRRRIMGAL